MLLYTTEAYSEPVLYDWFVLSRPRTILPSTSWLYSITYSYEKLMNLLSDLRIDSRDRILRAWSGSYYPGSMLRMDIVFFGGSTLRLCTVVWLLWSFSNWINCSLCGTGLVYAQFYRHLTAALKEESHFCKIYSCFTANISSVFYLSLSVTLKYE